MKSLLDQQKALLAEKLRILDRLNEGLQWSLERLPAVTATNLHEPAISERLSAIVDRYCKLQDQLAGAMRHVHAMLGEKSRSFQDVVTWATSTRVIPSPDVWLELRSLRNQLTHEYDLADSRLVALIALIRDAHETLAGTILRFRHLCEESSLLS